MRIPWRFDPRIARELKAQRAPIAIGLACTFVSGALYGGTITLTKIATDTVSGLEKATRNTPAADALLNQLAIVSLAVVGIFILRYAFVRGQVMALGIAANRLTADLRRRVMAKLLRLPVSYFSDRRSGGIQSSLTNDVGVYQSAIGILRDSIEAPVKAVTALVTIFILRWELAMVTLAMIPVLTWIISNNSRKVRRAQRTAQEDLASLAAEAQEILQGVRVVKAFGAERSVGEAFGRHVDRSYGSNVATLKLTATLRPLVELIGAIALAVVFYLGGRLALNGAGVGDIVALAFAMDTVNQGFRAFSSVSNTYSSVQAAADRIYGEILDVPEAHEGVGGRRLENVAGRIEFKNVGFTYPDGTRALDDVSFVLEPGTSLALVGPSGAGKSTVADLLLRFYDPTQGRILLDGIPLTELDPLWLRGLVGVVPQQTFLFAGSIEDNVRLGNPDASADSLALALHRAHASEFVAEFERRDLAELGERGVRLSGGQMQRVAIARALVREPKILLLDEATSALDAASESAVTEALGEAMEGRTSLFIAHRLTTAARADRILLLSRGKIVESGTHAALIAANGEYAAMFRLFSGGLLENSEGSAGGIVDAESV